MAEEVSLHPDTVSFLEKRNSARNRQAEAFAGEVATPEPETPEENPGEAACVVEAGGCINQTNKFNSVPSEEDPEYTEELWPTCDDLYSQVLESFANGDAAKLTRLDQRQINIIESYRRMLLHKKQRRCQLLAAHVAQMRHEPQSQGEVERLLLNQQVGREVVEYDIVGPPADSEGT